MKELTCMSMKDYIELSKRFRQTPEQMKVIANRMKENAHQLHALIGMETELGELFDIFKRHLIYGEEIDLNHAEEELGDFLYYFGLFLDVIGICPSDAMQGNFNKLSKRYPSGFSEEAGIARADKEGLPDDKRKEPVCTGCWFVYYEDGVAKCRCFDDGKGNYGKNYAMECHAVISCDNKVTERPEYLKNIQNTLKSWNEK